MCRSTEPRRPTASPTWAAPKGVTWSPRRPTRPATRRPAPRWRTCGAVPRTTRPGRTRSPSRTWPSRCPPRGPPRHRPPRPPSSAEPVPGFLTGLGAALADLVLPAACAGCAVERVPLRFGTCDGCAAELEALTPFPTAPDPPPYGMPACTAVGVYGGPLRSVLLAYKEKGRHRLARPLGALLATAIAGAAVRGGGGPGVPVLVLPVPSTARAARERHGDHMARLAAHAVRRLRVAGGRAGATP